MEALSSVGYRTNLVPVKEDAIFLSDLVSELCHPLPCGSFLTILEPAFFPLGPFLHYDRAARSNLTKHLIDDREEFRGVIGVLHVVHSANIQARNQM